MDEFPGLLARDLGFRPQGKNAPMSATKSSSTGSGRSRSGWNPSDSALGGGGGISGDRSPPSYDDVFNLSSQARVAPAPSSSSSYPDSIFDGFKDPAPKTSSMPVYDKPVYDDDIFEGVPGVKKPSSGGGIDDVFSTISSTAGDDFLDNLGKAMPQQKGSDRVSGEEVSGFEELIPGFGGSSPPRRREPHEAKQQSAAPSGKATSADPFVVLQTTHTSAYPSSGLFGEPLEHTSRSISSGGAKLDTFPNSGGVLDDLNIYDNIASSAPLFTSELNDKLKDQRPPKADDEPLQKSSMESSEYIIHPNKSSDSSNTGCRSGQNVDTSFNAYERNTMAEQASKSYEYRETADDVWLTVSEIPLFTQPTSAPPPSRPPPPVAIKQAPFGMTDQFSSVGYNARRKDTNPFSQFTKSEQHLKNSVKRPTESPIDEFESSVTGRSQIYGNEHAEVPNGEEEMEKNLAAAAMKEAMDRAEAKFKHARGVRERERDSRSAKNREPQQESDARVMPDTQDLEDKEKQYRLDREKEQREREEKEERKRREREREKELERERERERARQAVERATREARERAAVEARLKAERAAVEKANAEARQRAAEKAAFQRAANEAHGRATAEAREKAAQEVRAAADEAREKAAIAEAQRKTAAEAQEKAAAEMREKAALERVAADAQRRVQRIAVERATKEARERAAAEAQRRAVAAAAAAREKQQAADNDLESFFNVGARPNSAPKQRTPSENPFNPQSQSRGASDGVRRTPSSSSSTIRKTQSTTNIVDDLASVFGAPSSSHGEFQEIEGESDDRRRARFERHQRTLERAKKALAEKNERDMQAQNEQAERHRISETLDIEIRRWSAGKEGNLRALLSTLQYVLWPECGWHPVSLTDLITGASVKKVYRKATLCIHPDKVQQKGATLQQKYIAEKVFDLLKEAWNKFNSEELF